MSPLEPVGWGVLSRWARDPQPRDPAWVPLQKEVFPGVILHRGRNEDASKTSPQGSPQKTASFEIVGSLLFCSANKWF